MDLWEKFLLLPTWKQLLFFLPVVLVVLWYLLGHLLEAVPSKMMGDQTIKDHESRMKKLKAKSSKIDTEIVKLEKKLEESHAETEKDLATIGAADPDDLSAIAEELRDRHRSDIANRGGADG